MRKIKYLTLALLSLGLAACTNTVTPNETTSATESSTSSANEPLDQVVAIPQDTKFLAMSDKEKQAAYATLDKVNQTSDAESVSADYAQIIEIKGEQGYQDLVTDQAKAILYLGFDECPFCAAFTPKINHLAGELGLKIYYYDIRKHAQDKDFQEILAQFPIETVPHAFVLKDGKPDLSASLDHNSSMQEIEAFLKAFAK